MKRYEVTLVETADTNILKKGLLRVEFTEDGLIKDITTRVNGEMVSVIEGKNGGQSVMEIVDNIMNIE